MSGNDVKRLYRSKSDRMLAGVCGGLGVYFAVDPILIRALFLILFFLGGSSLIIYLVLWILIPEEPEIAMVMEEQEEEAGE